MHFRLSCLVGSFAITTFALKFCMDISQQLLKNTRYLTCLELKFLNQLRSSFFFLFQGIQYTQTSRKILSAFTTVSRNTHSQRNNNNNNLQNHPLKVSPNPQIFCYTYSSLDCCFQASYYYAYKLHPAQASSERSILWDICTEYNLNIARKLHRSQLTANQSLKIGAISAR